MADPISPDELAQHSFGARLRGYDPQEVRSFLDRLAADLRELRDERDRLAERLLELGDRDLTTEFATVAEEVDRVLQAAREAAEGMRKRAALEASAILEQAQQDAVALRSEAWTTSETLLSDSSAAADSMVQDAERNALAVIGEAERESHRRQTAGRREAEELIKTARLESERLLMDARSRSEDLVRDAERKVGAAEARAAAIEERRAEMLAELENARATIGKLEAEIEERREALSGPPPQDVESSSVRLLTDEPLEVGSWAEGGEAVRIVRPPKPIVEPPPEPVDAEAIAAEVARLRSQVPPPDEAVAEEPETVAGVSEPAAGAPETVAAEPAPSKKAGTELDDLFARLRTADEAAEPPEPATVVPSEEAAPSTPVAERHEPPADEEGPFDVRDRLLLPITNRVLRSVKKELTEAQNIALDELRSEEAWSPDAGMLGGRLSGPIEQLERDSFFAGFEAAAEITGSEVVWDQPAEIDGSSAVLLAGALTTAVEAALGEARAVGQGPRQLAAGLSRVYRAWRTDEAERRVRDLASGAFHRGLLRGLAAAGRKSGRWLVAGRGCATCREAAEAGSVPLGASFEDGVTAPPAHPDCSCTLAPALDESPGR